MEEIDPKLSGEEIRKLINKYMKKQKKIVYKINNSIAKTILNAVTWKENRDTEVIGIENIEGIKTGAIITSNHFNQLDSTIIRSFVKKTGRKKLYIVGQETNLAMIYYEPYWNNTNKRPSKLYEK